jgi:GNAT acetyltransferase-like protein
MGFVFVDRKTGRLIGSSRYYGHEPEIGEIEIGWTFLARSHWGGATNREVKRLMLDHAFTFVDTVIFWVGEENWRSQGAMTKIGGSNAPGCSRASSPATGRISSSRSQRAGTRTAAARWWRRAAAAQSHLASQSADACGYGFRARRFASPRSDELKERAPNKNPGIAAGVLHS